MRKLEKSQNQYRSRSACFGGFFDPEKLQKHVDELVQESLNGDLWNDPQKAKSVMQQKNQYESELNKFRKAESDFADLLELLKMAEETGDEQSVSEVESEIMKFYDFIQVYQLDCFFSGDADQNSCYLEIHAGAGGTEAQDWAQMLLRMYIRWSEDHGYSVETIEESPGEEAGLKSVTIKIDGLKAYGWLKGESGVHRLVRISPFDSNARRHTSFASVGVYPVIDDSINIEINEKDIRLDTYRASGAGGQHVNKTDSAVRITHIPTGIVVQCQTDRSQHRNKATAFEMLRSRLYELELRKKEEAENTVEKGSIGWGHQIRSYVMQPYQLVKDIRTGFEKGNVTAVLDGDIDDFLRSVISAKIAK